MMAVGRWLHLQQPPPHVFIERFALELAGDEGLQMSAAVQRELSAEDLASLTSWVAVRARFTEDMLMRALGDGIGQYVMLGAGLDSFAYRRPELTDQLHVYEVDHPLSQQWKRARLDELGLQRPPGLSFVPVDFERDALAQALAAAGADITAPAFFSWIGVTMYLTADAVRSMLRTVASFAPGSRIVLSYDLSREAVSKPGLYDFVRRRAAEVGEPFLSLFTPTEIDALLRECGFDGMRHFGPADAIREYFAARPGLEITAGQRLVLATVLPARGL
jgi:methyltransferase (TIGR00027 family)